MYVCENELGETKLCSSDELKYTNEFEKTYHYKNDIEDKWLTKTYVNTHMDEGWKLINRYPKASKVAHPSISK